MHSLGGFFLRLLPTLSRSIAYRLGRFGNLLTGGIPFTRFFSGPNLGRDNEQTTKGYYSCTENTSKILHKLTPSFLAIHGNLLQRGSILYTTIIPKIIQPPLYLQGRPGSKIPIKDLSIVSYLSYYLNGPVIFQTKTFSTRPLQPE